MTVPQLKPNSMQNDSLQQENPLSELIKFIALWINRHARPLIRRCIGRGLRHAPCPNISLLESIRLFDDDIELLWTFFRLGRKEYSGNGNLKPIMSLERVLGIEPMEEDGRCGSCQLWELEYATNFLDESYSLCPFLRLFLSGHVLQGRELRNVKVLDRHGGSIALMDDWQLAGWPILMVDFRESRPPTGRVRVKDNEAGLKSHSVPT